MESERSPCVASRFVFLEDGNMAVTFTRRDDNPELASGYSRLNFAKAFHQCGGEPRGMLGADCGIRIKVKLRIGGLEGARAVVLLSAKYSYGARS